MHQKSCFILTREMITHLRQWMKISKFKQDVINSIAQRSRFKLELKSVLFAIFCLPKWWCRWKSVAKYKFDTFEWGDRKAKNELDIQFIVSSIRIANAVAAALLNKQQQILCKYQSSSLICAEDTTRSNNVVPKSSLNLTHAER